MAKIKEMKEILEGIVKDYGLEGILIADYEGLPLASHLPAGMDEYEIAATSAAVLVIVESKIGSAGKGAIHQASIEAEGGYFVITPIKGDYVASVLASNDAKLGIVLSAVKSIESKI